MPTWAEVSDSPGYKGLPPDKQEAARDSYFQTFVAPRVPKDQLSQVRAQFDQHTKAPPSGTPATVPKAGGGTATVMVPPEATPEQAAKINAAGPAPVDTSVTADRLAKQFTEGEYSGVLGTGMKAGARAAGLPQPGVPAGSTRNIPEKLAYGAGLGSAVLADVMGGRVAGPALEAAGVAPETIAAALRWMKANPKAAASLVGAGIGGATSAGQQYADTGQVSGEKVVANALASGAIGLGSTIGAQVLSAPVRGAYKLATGTDKPGALIPQAPGQVLSETTEAARSLASSALDTTEGQKRLGEIAAQRTGAAAAALTEDASTPEAAIARAVRNDVGDTSAGIGESQRATKAEAESAKAAVGTPADVIAEGAGYQAATEAKIQQLEGARAAAAAPLYKEASDIASESKPNAAALKSAFIDKVPTVSAPQREQLEAIYSNVVNAFTGEEKTLVLGPDGKPLVTQATGGTETPYETMREYSRQLSKMQDAAKASGDAPMERATAKARAALEGELTRMTKRPDGTSVHALAQAKYQEMSQPINAIQEAGKAGDFARKVQELREYKTNSDTGEKYEIPKEAIGDSMVGAGSQGAEVVRATLGDQGANSFTSGYFARKVGKMDSAGVRGLIDQNDAYLRAFPEIRQRMEQYQQKLAADEAIEKAGNDALKENVKRAKLGQSEVPLKDPEAKAAVQGLIRDSNLYELKEISRTLKRQKGFAGEQLGRDAVANYFGGKFDDLRKFFSTTPEKPGQVASKIESVTNEWGSKKQALIDSGMITKAHAADIQTEMDKLTSLTRAISHTPAAKELAERGRFGKFLERIAELGSHHFTGWSGRAVTRDAWYNFIDRRARQMAEDAISNPETAKKIADRIKTLDAGPMLDFVMGYQTATTAAQAPSGNPNDAVSYVQQH